MMNVKVSKEKNINRGLIETTSSILDKIESKSVHKDEEADR